jgi:hypothetical protein
MKLTTGHIDVGALPMGLSRGEIFDKIRIEDRHDIHHSLSHEVFVQTSNGIHRSCEDALWRDVHYRVQEVV